MTKTIKVLKFHCSLYERQKGICILSSWTVDKDNCEYERHIIRTLDRSVLLLKNQCVL